MEINENAWNLELNFNIVRRINFSKYFYYKEVG